MTLRFLKSKFTGEHPCRSVISIKSLCNFIEIALHAANLQENTHAKMRFQQSCKAKQSNFGMGVLL